MIANALRPRRWTAFWFVMLMAAAWWPSRFLGPFDGAPLDRPLEAVWLGLALPWLFLLGRDVCSTTSFRVAVLALLSWKLITFTAAGQQGLCATFRSPQPLSGTAQTMRIDEPRGYLRSWDLRGDIWADEPVCTAVLSRPMRTTEEFPAWFVNITDQMLGRREFTMTVSGVAADAGGQVRAIDESMSLGSEPWKYDPIVNGHPVWNSPLVMTKEPSRLDRWLAPWAWMVAPALSILLLALTLWRAAKPLVAVPAAMAWVVIGVVLAVAMALAPSDAVHRISGALALGAIAVAVPEARRSTKTAIWLIGAPWLTFFAVSSLGLVGRFSAYSVDDWLAYQVAGYRIYMNGHWLEAGTAVFDYQPLYRWVTGALHLVFGDSSVGEIYADASWLLIGGVLAFRLIQPIAGFRWAVTAAALALATMTVSTPWYIIGRGLSEITAAGFGFLAMLCLLQVRGRERRWVLLAGVMASLMFCARLNHLLWAPCLVLLLIPRDVDANWRRAAAAIANLPWASVAMYLGVFAAAVLAFMTRTWYFTGRFSLFYGTALRHNDTGLRPWHLFDAQVWSKVAHSLAGLVFMNEPPHADPRAAIVVIGVTIGVLAMWQTPLARKVPAGILIVAIGSVLSAFLAHSHGYPGRFTVHLIPLASALSVVAAAAMTNQSARG
jgi:hypothetical protein